MNAAIPVLALLLAGTSELLPDGTPAPVIEARGPDGRAWRHDFEGRVTVVDFFATWCPQCRRSLPDYERLLAAFGDRVRVVIVDVEEDPAIVRAFFARRRLRAGAQVVLDTSGATARAWRVSGYPTVYVVDGRGVIQDQWAGWDDDCYNDLTRMITYLEAEEARARRGARKRGGAAPPARAAATEDERARRMGVEIVR